VEVSEDIIQYTQHQLSYTKTVYRTESFPSKESDTKILQSLHFACQVGIVSIFCMRMKDLDTSYTLNLQTSF